VMPKNRASQRSWLAHFRSKAMSGFIGSFEFPRFPKLRGPSFPRAF
jgi:hypothetical protein